MTEALWPQEWTKLGPLQQVISRILCVVDTVVPTDSIAVRITSQMDGFWAVFGLSKSDYRLEEISNP